MRTRWPRELARIVMSRMARRGDAKTNCSWFGIWIMCEIGGLCNGFGLVRSNHFPHNVCQVEVPWLNRLPSFCSMSLGSRA